MTITQLIIGAIAIFLLWRVFSMSNNSAPMHKGANLEVARLALEKECESLGSAHNDFLKIIVYNHSRVLGRKLRQHLRKDEYGKDIGFDEAGNVVAHFLSHVVATEPGYHELRQRFIGATVDLTLLGRNREEYEVGALATDIHNKLEENMIGLVYLWAIGDGQESERQRQGQGQGQGQGTNVAEMTGTEFEAYCAEWLQSDGWSVHRNGGTGDQGVDLLAQHGSTLVAIQCKRHSRAVGNEAVQQIAAGKQFEEADLAVVVSDGRYTESAKRLAAKLGVILMHHTDLDLLRQHASQRQE